MREQTHVVPFSSRWKWGLCFTEDCFQGKVIKELKWTASHFILLLIQNIHLSCTWSRLNTGITLCINKVHTWVKVSHTWIWHDYECVPIAVVQLTQTQSTPRTHTTEDCRPLNYVQDTLRPSIVWFCAIILVDFIYSIQSWYYNNERIQSWYYNHERIQSWYYNNVHIQSWYYNNVRIQNWYYNNVRTYTQLK